MCDRVRGGFKLSVGVCRCVGMNGYGEVGRRVWLYPGTPGIIVSNLSVALRLNEKDLERFEIAA